MGRERGAKPRADVQEPDRRRYRSRRAGLRHCKAFVVKEEWRKFGGCAAVKDRVLTRGDLSSHLKGRRRNPEPEVSRGCSSRHEGVKGRRNRRECSVILWIGMSQMFAQRSSPKGGGG